VFSSSRLITSRPITVLVLGGSEELMLMQRESNIRRSERGLKLLVWSTFERGWCLVDILF